MKEFMDELKNWWWYNKRFVLIGLVVLAICAYMFIQSAGETEPDYFVGMVSTVPRSPEELAALEKRITDAGEDINGDGEVVLQLKSYAIDLDDPSPNAGYNNYEKIAALDGDLVGKISGIFLMDEPEAFQDKTNGILAQPIVEFEPGLYMALRFDADEAYIDLFNNLS